MFAEFHGVAVQLVYAEVDLPRHPIPPLLPNLLQNQFRCARIDERGCPFTTKYLVSPKRLQKRRSNRSRLFQILRKYSFAPQTWLGHDHTESLWHLRHPDITVFVWQVNQDLVAGYAEV